MRFHAKKDLFWHPARTCPDGWDGGSRLPWEWGPTVLESIRNSVRLRAALNPYIYTLMRAAHDTGVPLCRGMYLDWPERDEAYRFDQYLFGEAFLVAPTMRPSGDGQHGSDRTFALAPRRCLVRLFHGQTPRRRDAKSPAPRTSEASRSTYGLARSFR